MKKKILVFATGNQHKIDEISKVLDVEKYHVVSMKDMGITQDISETGETLEENAGQKAAFVYDILGENVFAEDTGLEVEALDNAPGVYTARYAGDQRDPQKNMDYLLLNLEGKENRNARFRTVISLIYDGNEYLFEGVVKGEIAKAKSGTRGFGYDPVFVPEGYDRTFGELPDEIKLSISHRTRAFQKMIDFLSNF